MQTSWAQRYSIAAANSRLSSQIGAFIILVIGLMEAIRIVGASLAAEDLSWVAVWTGAVPTGLFLLAFGSRFFLLFRFASSLMIRSVTWWLLLVTVWFCSEYFGPEPGVIYDLFHSFPLVTSGTIFVLLGCLRFLYFASVSFKHERNPDS